MKENKYMLPLMVASSIVLFDIFLRSPFLLLLFFTCLLSGIFILLFYIAKTK